MAKSLVVFFSWQSEVFKNANRHAIEASLRAAASQIEHDYASIDLAIHIDKDTATWAVTPENRTLLLPVFKSKGKLSRMTAKF